jgi:hypothetical protein
MATNRIINSITRLTATIAGIQDAPPDKMEAIQSLCTLLLGKVAQLPPPTPSILPTPPPPTPMVDADELVIIWNPHLVQPPLPTHNLDTNNIDSNCNTPALSRTTVTTTHLSPVNAPAHLITISFAHCKTVLSQAIN